MHVFLEIPLHAWSRPQSNLLYVFLTSSHCKPFINKSNSISHHFCSDKTCRLILSSWDLQTGKQWFITRLSKHKFILTHLTVNLFLFSPLYTFHVTKVFLSCCPAAGFRWGGSEMVWSCSDRPPHVRPWSCVRATSAQHEVQRRCCTVLDHQDIQQHH